MPFTLNGNQLPTPKKFERKFIELATQNTNCVGKLSKKVLNRKEQYILDFQHLTTAQVNAILAEYELQQVLTFTVDETNLSIGPTDVLVEVGQRKYPPTGVEMRENFSLILTEVK